MWRSQLVCYVGHCKMGPLLIVSILVHPIPLVSDLTERKLHYTIPWLQVDIFTLGSCLYEFMTLRCLPPDDISEIEYKHMLQSGKKPQFYRRVSPNHLCIPTSQVELVTLPRCPPHRGTSCVTYNNVSIFIKLFWGPWNNWALELYSKEDYT